MPLRNHEIMIPRSGGGAQNVNPGKANETFAEHGSVFELEPALLE